MPLANFSERVNQYDSQAPIQQESAKNLVDQALKYTKTKVLKVADLGCGTGSIGKILKKRMPDFKMNNCDISQAMLDKAASSLGTQNSRYTKASIPADSDYDLIFSNFALQWYDNLAQSLDACIQKLSQEGILAISLPINDSFEKLKEAFQYANADEYFFKFPHLEIIQQSLQKHEILTEEITESKMVFNCTFDAFKNLHSIGANQIDKKIPIQKLRKLIRYHDELFDGKIIVTYKILKMIAKRRPQ